MSTLRFLPVALLALCLTAAQEAQEPPDTLPLRVEAVRLAGVHALEPFFVREAMVTRASRCRSPLLAPVCALTDARWAEETALLDPAEVERDEQLFLGRVVYDLFGFDDPHRAQELWRRLQFQLSMGLPF